MYLICSDLEGVFVPEIWIGVSAKTGIDELKLTTRDISNYDELMSMRLATLKKHGLKLDDIREVISTLDPLPGANEFLTWLRSKMPVIIVSDTFSEFAGPLIRKLGYPLLFCHNLTVDEKGNITGYNLRQKDSKRMAAESMMRLNYRVIGIGDSYNDLSMLRAADKGLLFNPPANVAEENSDLPVFRTYDELKKFIKSYSQISV
ncbi:MAG TPA: bifunctional phosphoserine phosphatase/homoserine phosphotransferase ThrH [Bacteroidales bacterium]|jgi:phosphoserine/homoserine phosphotransferase|nr:bifunctional phosphoserine phosphatase/homoserine phosphotransferase ThrH [Bacteroidales bacterium]